MLLVLYDVLAALANPALLELLVGLLVEGQALARLLLGLSLLGHSCRRSRTPLRRRGPQ